MSRPYPSVSEFREAIAYDPETGALTWKDFVNRYGRRYKGRVGKRADNTLDTHGYPKVRFQNRFFRAHRIIWLMTYGYLVPEIDHINGDRADNRLANLRETTRTMNNANARKRRDNGLPKGVELCNGLTHKTPRYRSRIVVNGDRIGLGCYGTPEEAHAAYLTAARQHFGDFARGG